MTDYYEEATVITLMDKGFTQDQADKVWEEIENSAKQSKSTYSEPERTNYHESRDGRLKESEAKVIELTNQLARANLLLVDVQSPPMYNPDIDKTVKERVEDYNRTGIRF